MSQAELVVVVLLGGMLLVGLFLLVRTKPLAPDGRLRGLHEASELQTMSVRLSAVERAVEVVRAELAGVKDGVVRVERMTDLLLKHKIGIET